MPKHPAVITVLLLLVSGLALAGWAANPPDTPSLLAKPGGYAQAGPLVLTGATEVYPLGLHLDYLADPGKKFTFDQVSSPAFEPKWQHSREEVPNFGSTPTTAYWVRLRVINQAPPTFNWLLEVDFPGLHAITLYLPSPDGRGYTTRATGYVFPFASRDVPHYKFVFNLPLPSDTEQVLYLRVEDAVISLPLKIWSAAAFAHKSQVDYLFHGLFYGAMLVLVVYNAFLFISLRDRSYLYFVLYLGSNGLYMSALDGLAPQFLWPNQTWLNYFIIPLLVELAVVNLLLFTRVFLNTRTATPWLHRLTSLLLIGLGVLLGLTPILGAIQIMLPLLIFVAVCFGVSLLIVLIVWWKGYGPAGYYLLAWGVVLGAAGLVVGARLDWLNLGDNPEWIFRFSLIGLGLLLSFALAARIKLAQQEKEQAQADLVWASREKERLVREQNALLEQKVQDRTAELITARDQAEAANRAKSTFLANMSHELRTPLNSILGYAYLWQQDPALSPEPRRQAGVIEQSGQHLLGLIEDVLDIAKIEAGRVVLRPEELNLATFVQSLGHLVRPQAEAKGLAFGLELAPDLPARVMADEKRLRQILLNLLGNAVKFTTTGRVSLAVSGGGTASPADLRFSVADTGPGLPAEELARIFEPFHQAGSEQAQAQGAGLGLAISQKLAGLMGGRIEVTSQPGQGSTFTLTVALPTVAGEPPAPAAAGPVITGYSGGPYTLLIVDDNAANRAVLRDILAPLGFTVVEAEDGQQGLEQAVQLQPSLVLVDLRMPRLNGLEMTRRLRALPGCQETPIISISASAYEADRQEFLEAGGSAFLAKPVHLPDLLALLQAHLALEWRCQPPDSAALPLPPPPAIMARLRDAAIQGNITGLRACLEELDTLGPAYEPFAAALRPLVNAIKIKDIKALLRQYEAI